MVAKVVASDVGHLFSQQLWSRSTTLPSNPTPTKAATIFVLIFHPYWISTPTKPNQKKKSQTTKNKHYFLLMVQLLHILPWDLGLFSPFFSTLGNSRFINSPWSDIHENQPTLNKPSRLSLSSEGTHLVTQNAGHLATSQKHRVREEIGGWPLKGRGQKIHGSFWRVEP